MVLKAILFTPLHENGKRIKQKHNLEISEKHNSVKLRWPPLSPNQQKKKKTTKIKKKPQTSNCKVHIKTAFQKLAYICFDAGAKFCKRTYIYDHINV